MGLASFLINGLSGPQVVSQGSTVTLSLVSTMGVRFVSWSIFGTHDQTGSLGYVTPTITVSPGLGSTATIVLPSGLGQTLGIRCTVNGGKDASGRKDPNAISTSSVAVLNGASLRLGFENETTEWSGWLPIINNAINAIAAIGTGGVGNVLSAGTQVANPNGIVQFSNANGVSFGMASNSVITASVANTGGGGTNYVFSNSNNVSFGTNGSTVTASASYPSQTAFVFSNSNGLTFGTNGSTVTGSYTVPTQTAFVLSNSNGISFGTNGSTVTASYSVPAQTSVSYSNANGVSFGLNGSTLTASVAAQTAPVFSNSNGISFGTNGSTVTASYTVPSTAGLISRINISAGSTSNNLSAFTLSNSNGLSFGLNGSVITGSYTVPTIPGATSFSNSNNVSFGLNGSTITASASFAQTNQTQGLYALGNTTGQSSSSTFDARTLSISGAGIASVGYSGNALVISVPSAGASVNFSAGTTSGNLNAVTFSNSNGVSFGLNAGVITASVAPGAAAGVAAIYDGANSISSGTIRYSNANGVSFGINGQTLTGSVAAQTAFQLSNSNGISFGTNGSTVTASYTVPSTAGLISGINLSAGTTSNNLTAFTLSNSNGLAFGLNGSVVTGSYTVPTQSAQSVGLYALGNTTQNSSTTLDARSLSFNGLGAATVGYSNGSIQVSVPTQTSLSFSNANGVSFGIAGSTVTGSVAAQSAFVFSNSNNVSFGTNGSTVTATVTFAQSVQTQSNIQGIYDGANSISTGTIRFSNANGVSFGINGQTLTGSVAAQTNQTVGIYAVSNTTQSSSGTLDARSLSFRGAGVASVGYSNGSVVVSVPSGGGGLTNVNVSAGTTSNNLSNFVFSNSNSVSFGLNGSTITASVGTQQYVLSDSNNVSFGLNGSTITATAGQTINFYGVSNTTQSSSGTIDARTLSFRGAGNVSVGYSNGSVVISATGGGAGGGIANQAGTQTATSGTVIFSNSNGVSFGMSNSSVITASFNGTLNSVVMSNANNIVFGSAGNTTITASYNPGTISSASFVPGGAITNTQNANNSMSFRYFSLDRYLSLTQMAFPMVISLSSGANTTVGSLAFTSGGALYTRNGSTLSPLVGTTGNTTYTWASNTANFNNVNGVRNVPFALATVLPPGEYWAGAYVSTASTNFANSISALVGSQYTGLNVADFGAATNNSLGFVRMQGLCATVLTATSQTFQESQITAAGSVGMRGNVQVIFR